MTLNYLFEGKFDLFLIGRLQNSEQRHDIGSQPPKSSDATQFNRPKVKGSQKIFEMKQKILLEL